MGTKQPVEWVKDFQDGRKEITDSERSAVR
jgi:hypothetical protein